MLRSGFSLLLDLSPSVLRLCGHSTCLPKWSELLLEMFAGVQDPLGSRGADIPWTTLSQQSISAYPPGGRELTHGPSGFWSYILTQNCRCAQTGWRRAGGDCVCECEMSREGDHGTHRTGWRLLSQWGLVSCVQGNETCDTFALSVEKPRRAFRDQLVLRLPDRRSGCSPSPADAPSGRLCALLCFLPASSPPPPPGLLLQLVACRTQS